jgi:hypothetical protein
MDVAFGTVLPTQVCWYCLILNFNALTNTWNSYSDINSCLLLLLSLCRLPLSLLRFLSNVTHLATRSSKIIPVQYTIATYLSGYSYPNRVANAESTFTASAVHGVEWPVLPVGCFTGENVGRYTLCGAPNSVCELYRTWHIAHSANHSIDYKDKIHVRIEGKINRLMQKRRGKRTVKTFFSYT